MADLTAEDIDKRTREIKARAKDVYKISFNYHLTHAVFGGDKLLMLYLKETNEEKSSGLNKALQIAVRAGDNDLKDKLMDEIKAFDRTLEKRKYHILIEYHDITDIGGGRAINADNKLIISLPKKLTENLMDDAGSLQQEAVKQIREKMAHELGHIVLHTKDLPKGNLEGADKLNHLDWEADVFAKELLRLYCKKDHHMDWKDV